MASATFPRAVPVALACLVVFAAVTQSVVRSTASDPRGTLLVSEAIVREGTLALDSYAARIDPADLAFHEEGGHLHSSYPIGTSLFSVPFVALENAMGRRMLRYEEETQIRIAAIVSLGIFLALFAIARLYFGSAPSLFFAALFWFGTSYSSTLATALWSHDFAVLFSLGAIWLALRAHVAGRRVAALPLAGALFAAYLCRPTLALLAPAILAFVFLVSKRDALRTAGWLALFLAAFAGFSYREFGKILPDYYAPARPGEVRFLSALGGNLASPGRGLLSFTPMLALPFLFFVPTARRLASEPRYVVFLLWAAAHLVMISLFPHWWGGHSYGPRLMVDAVAAFFVVFLLCARSLRSRLAVAAFAASAAVLGSASVAIHTAQGLFNRHAALWNREPDVDAFPEYVFDWRFPQFLHDAGRHRRRATLHAGFRLPPIRIGRQVAFDSGSVLFVDWSPAEAAHRWSEGHASEILFRCDRPAKSAPSGRLALWLGAFGEQSIRVALNETPLGGMTIAGEGIREFRFDPTVLRYDDVNSIRFDLPGARRADNGDSRALAVLIKWLLVE